MMADYEQIATFPSLPPHAITVEQQRVLEPLSYPKSIDTRTSHSRQVVALLQDLHQSITPPERWQSLQRALNLVSHDVTELHDYEISLGLDKALCLKLGYVVVTTKSNCASKEVTLICSCLLQIFKCSSKNRLRSFHHIGATELLPILIQFCIGIIKCKIDMEDQSPEHDDGLVSIVRVLRVFSKLIPAKSFLINYLQGAYLGHLLRDMLIWIDDPASSIIYSSTEVLWEAIGVLKDLTFRSQTNDKETLLHLEGGVLLKILSICCGGIKASHPRIQEWCTAVIWNLALDPQICRKLVFGNDTHESGGNVILDGLLEVLTHYSADSKISGYSLKIKRNAMSAIGNIVLDSQNSSTLFKKKCTDKSSEILQRLMSLVQNDSDSVVRRRAMRTIRCLASSGVNDTILLRDLSSLLVDIISQKGSENDENDEDMHVQVCQTIIILKETIDAKIWPRLQKSLVCRIETTTSIKIISAAIVCLSNCFSDEHSIQNWDGFSDTFWTSLERTTTANLEAHESVSKLLLGIANNEGNIRDAGDRGIRNPSILTKTAVVNTLTTILLESECNREEPRNQALQTVQILAGNEINKRPLAENDRLLSGLVTLCLTQPDPGIKDSAKGVILQLVPEL